MGDEKEGPYKVVSKLVKYGESLRYSIVKQEKNDVFLREIVPDAGEGSSARTICNLLNKDHKRREEAERVETAGTDGVGLDSTDLGDGEL